MKDTLLTLFSIITIGINAQNVGINTEEPTRALDINGELRIRQVDTGNFEGSFLIPTQGKDKNETHLVKQTKAQFKHVFTGVSTKTYEVSSTPKEGNVSIVNNQHLNVNTNGHTRVNYIDAEHITYPYYGNYIGIKTPGIYYVKISGRVNIKEPEKDEFNGSFGRVDVSLWQYPIGNIPFVELLRSSNNIFQGSANSKGKGGGVPYYDFTASGVYLFQGGNPLYLTLYTYGANGIASSPDKVTFPAGNTSISIYKLL